MAKNLSGEFSIVSANRLADGVVVFLDDAGQWTARLDRAAVARDKRTAEILLERARVEAFSVIDPFLVAVTEDDQGRIEPVSLREKIRASGLTFDAIAADSVRYA
jgi:hypothetical protein